jgi:hypothetical protein
MKNTETNISPLSKEEWELWANLTKRIKFIDGKIPLDAFYAFCESFISPVIDVIPYKLTSNGVEILLIYRKDKYYDGFHLPGSVITPGQTSVETLNSVIKNEIGPNTETGNIKFIKVIDTMKGFGVDLDSRGQNLKLLYGCEIKGNVLNGEWFSENSLPENIIPEHKNLVRSMFEYLNKLE